MKTRWVERALFLLGLTLLLLWGVARLDGVIGSHLAMRNFDRSERQAHRPNFPISQKGFPDVEPSTLAWSPERVEAYYDSIAQKKTDPPLAVLRIPKIGLRAPVFNGTDDLTLNRGVGRIPGTAQLGQIGNLGIAGHRDGFFRGLQDIGEGDEVELELHGHIDTYTVNEIRIVAPDDVWVLDPTPVATLTLVTCFPFHFVGHAPKRYVVVASITSGQPTDLASSKHPSPSGRNREEEP